MLRKDLALWLPNAFTFLYHCCLIMIIQILIAGIVSPSWQGSDLFNGLTAIIVIFIAIFIFFKLNQIISVSEVGGLALKLDLRGQLKLWLFSNFIIWMSVLCVFLSSILINIKNTLMFSDREKTALNLAESLIRFRTLEVNENKKKLFSKIDSLAKQVNSPNAKQWVEVLQNDREANSYVFFRFVTYSDYLKARYLDSLFVDTYNESLQIVNKKSGIIDLVYPRQISIYSLQKLKKYDNPTKYVLEEGEFMSEYVEFDSAKYKPVSKDSIFYEAPIIGPNLQSLEYIKGFREKVRASPYPTFWNVLLVFGGISILMFLIFNLNLVFSRFIYYKNLVSYQFIIIVSCFIPLILSAAENKMIGIEDNNAADHPTLSPYGVSVFYFLHLSFILFLLFSKKFNPKNIAHVAFAESFLGIHVMVVGMFLFYEKENYNYLNDVLYYLLPLFSIVVGAIHIYVMKKISIMPKPR